MDRPPNTAELEEAREIKEVVDRVLAGRHAAFAEFVLNRVAVREGGGEALGDLGHTAIGDWRMERGNWRMRPLQFNLQSPINNVQSPIISSLVLAHSPPRTGTRKHAAPLDRASAEELSQWLELDTAEPLMGSTE